MCFIRQQHYRPAARGSVAHTNRSKDICQLVILIVCAIGAAGASAPQEARAQGAAEATAAATSNNHKYSSSSSSGPRAPQQTDDDLNHHSKRSTAAATDDDHLKHENVHKLMSEQDLRRTFQVDSHDQVPEYEILKLTVNSDGSHLISPTPATSTHASEHDNKLIVMNLSTFGRDFKLRLKRNADFQQRIKDMKIFMAESTQDGRLKYTEVNSHNGGNQHHSGNINHRQEPHKRAVTLDDELSGKEKSPPEANADAKSPPSSSSSSTPPTSPPAASSSSSALTASLGGNLWNIGSTYHDEDNLAALLIEHDKKTGQLRVDGTIGNDFVIKPMPIKTVEAIDSELKRRQTNDRSADSRLMDEKLHSAAGGGTAAAAVAAAAAGTADDLNRRGQTSGGSASAMAAERAANSVDSEKSTIKSIQSSGADDRKKQQSAAAGLSTTPSDAQQLEQLATHLHDDDPHDDDEMFLDEDEALELAHIQASVVIDSNHTGAGGNSQATKATHNSHATGGQTQQQQQQQPRTLSKLESERKWKKYRKLMAQTQVPKPHQVSTLEITTSSTTSAPSGGRTRRHSPAVAAAEPEKLSVSHHFVYKLKPTAEKSSQEHQSSFMLAPGRGKSMDQLAQQLANSFASPSSSSSRLAAEREAADADFEPDPYDGQFYLEPGSVTGVGRAGQADWSLLAGVRPLNSSEPALASNASTAHHRSKRHARPGHVHGFRNNRQMPMRARPSQVRRKRQAPDTVWPEVLLVVDYDSFLLHGGDSRDVKRYFVSFWNGVDLRYKLLVHPHIRISLAGMIVAKDRDATPYLERNRLRAPNADAVDAAGALTDMGKYLYREDRLPTYDLAVVITKLDMCRRRYEGGRCNRGTAGFAYVGGACVVNKRLEKVNSVAIIEDSGGFSGIIVAAHEVGHLLGCVHDGSPPPSYLGGPGATHCPWEDGFIMSDLRHTERGFRWSQCSVEQFKHFLNGETATCLYNYPHESQMLHRLLPGTMLSLDEQCKRDRGTNACFKDARVCAQLFCFDSASGYCVSYRPAAEGSPCGEGQVCRNGKCVGEIENIIPDYTHQTQTIVAARRPAIVAAPPPGHHALARLTSPENGLSASSTSTATSSPNDQVASAELPKSAISSSAAALTSRMDTFGPSDQMALLDQQYSAAPGDYPTPIQHHHHHQPYQSTYNPYASFGGRRFGLMASASSATTASATVASPARAVAKAAATSVTSKQPRRRSKATMPTTKRPANMPNNNTNHNNNKNHHNQRSHKTNQLSSSSPKSTTNYWQPQQTISQMPTLVF